MSEDYDDRRRAPRSDIQDTLFIKSINSSQVTSLGSDFRTCSTINVSAYGMQVILDFEVLIDSEIALWIVQDEGEDRVLVDGTVRWTSKVGQDSKYLVGIELNEDSVGPIETWIKRNTPQTSE